MTISFPKDAITANPALKVFLDYVLHQGQQFNHQFGFLNLEDPHGKVARWHAELSQFNYSLKYIKGELNTIADAVSRNFESVATLNDNH